MPKELRR
jgi:predicted pyridoxine 5'-phosphate oxidase superfamily flavin-nucleotide-binding protein